ncbi:hypothetical protein AB0M87_03805 [Streptomyces sp. NPDC051320]|uniref:hypothetical protein n=1 Tax=unclassified Streptomyces TaxID=2593676 RepID=UPI003415D457
MTSAFQIATQEISENELDAMSGGVGGGVTVAGGVDGLVPAGFSLSTQGGADISALTGLTGLAGGLTGLVPTV